MRQQVRLVCTLFVGVFFAGDALAEKYDFEIGASLDSTRFDGNQVITTTGGAIANSAKIDTDDVGVFARWYFSGLSDGQGPRSRAALVDRASSLSIGYSNVDQTTTFFLASSDPLIPSPPTSPSINTDGDTLAVDVLYVDKDSGWFGSAGILSTDVSLSGFVSDSVDAKGWRLGVGKYLFETTTLSLDIGQVDADAFGNSTAYSVAFEHLGRFGSQWQYAVDINFSRSDPEFGTEIDEWSARFSLYPSRDFEVGLGIVDRSGSGIGQDTNGIEGFASSFVTPNFQLAARYRADDPNFFGNVSIAGASVISDADQDSFGVTATIRF